MSKKYRTVRFSRRFSQGALAWVARVTAGVGAGSKGEKEGVWGERVRSAERTGVRTG